eukprot:TRINITY_DN3696_c0_g1_i1.p1 TRINITY_DN3696_c0_g1~~TRINITY_DN3696_c0_g1_i1.p1  ORF type:complete len:111 (-),score=24.55 TRINITY_DN3696_c0_g1_i1:41-373(-)
MQRTILSVLILLAVCYTFSVECAEYNTVVAKIYGFMNCSEEEYFGTQSYDVGICYSDAMYSCDGETVTIQSYEPPQAPWHEECVSVDGQPESYSVGECALGNPSYIYSCK